MSSIKIQTLQHFELISSNVKTFFFFFFLYIAAVSIHFLYPVQGRFSWKSYIVLIKNILNYCRSNEKLKSTLCIHSTYFNCLYWGCDWYAKKKKKNHSKSYSMVTWLGVFGAPPGGGKGLGSLRSCQLTHLWYTLFQWSSCKPCIQIGHPQWEQVFGFFFLLPLQQMRANAPMLFNGKKWPRNTAKTPNKRPMS